MKKFFHNSQMAVLGGNIQGRYSILHSQDIKSCKKMESRGTVDPFQILMVLPCNLACNLFFYEFVLLRQSPGCKEIVRKFDVHF